MQLTMQNIGGRPFIRGTLLSNVFLAGTTFYMFTSSARDASEEGFQWFSRGLLVGGPIVSALFAILEIWFYKRRLAGSTIYLKPSLGRLVITPEIVGFISLFLLWGVLTPFSVPKEIFWKYSSLTAVHRFLEGILAVEVAIGMVMQYAWAAYVQRKAGTTLMIRVSMNTVPERPAGSSPP